LWPWCIWAFIYEKRKRKIPVKMENPQGGQPWGFPDELTYFDVAS